MEQFNSDLDKTGMIGIFTGTIVRNGEIISVDSLFKNKVLMSGRNAIQNRFFTTAVKQDIYFFLSTATSTPADTATLADILTASPEFTAYSESTRPIFTPVVTDDYATNAASKAEFTATAGGTITSVGACFNATIGSNTGAVFCFTNLPVARSLLTGDKFILEYKVQLVSV